MKTVATLFAAALLTAPAAFAANPHGMSGNATGGSAGTAAINGTSATTLGTGATSTGANGNTGSAEAMGGSAAGGTSDSTRAFVHGNRNLNGQAMAAARDGGTFSRSHTHCHTQAGSDVNCRTKTMAHEPGSKPEMSTTNSDGSMPASMSGH